MKLSDNLKLFNVQPAQINPSRPLKTIFTLHNPFYLFIYFFFPFKFTVFVSFLAWRKKPKRAGSVFTNHSQEHSLSLSPRFANWNVTQLLIG